MRVIANGISCFIPFVRYISEHNEKAFYDFGPGILCLAFDYSLTPEAMPL